MRSSRSPWKEDALLYFAKVNIDWILFCVAASLPLLFSKMWSWILWAIVKRSLVNSISGPLNLGLELKPPLPLFPLSTLFSLSPHLDLLFFFSLSACNTPLMVFIFPVPLIYLPPTHLTQETRTQRAFILYVMAVSKNFVNN
jgi:hypothetical protein